jgi:hypothetical protein
MRSETDLWNKLEQERYALFMIMSFAMVGFCFGAMLMTVVIMLT